MRLQMALKQHFFIPISEKSGIQSLNNDEGGQSNEIADGTDVETNEKVSKLLDISTKYNWQLLTFPYFISEISVS